MRCAAMFEIEAGELMLPIKSLEARLRWMAVFIEKLCSRADFPRTAMGVRRDDKRVCHPGGRRGPLFPGLRAAP